jgi:hypothetical protein
VGQSASVERYVHCTHNNFPALSSRAVGPFHRIAGPPTLNWSSRFDGEQVGWVGGMTLPAFRSIEPATATVGFFFFFLTLACCLWAPFTVLRKSNSVPGSATRSNFGLLDESKMFSSSWPCLQTRTIPCKCSFSDTKRRSVSTAARVPV